MTQTPPPTVEYPTLKQIEYVEFFESHYAKVAASLMLDAPDDAAYLPAVLADYAHYRALAHQYGLLRQYELDQLVRRIAMDRADREGGK